MNTIFITHCSGTKDDSLKDTGKSVTPDVLYTSRRIKSFIKRCMESRVKWAIFSDYYGIWFADEKHQWYEKHPDTVTNEEYKKLLNSLDSKLKIFDTICFYYNPARFHRLYKKLLEDTALRDRIIKFSHVNDIEKGVFHV